MRLKRDYGVLKDNRVGRTSKWMWSLGFEGGVIARQIRLAFRYVAPMRKSSSQLRDKADTKARCVCRVGRQALALRRSHVLRALIGGIDSTASRASTTIHTIERLMSRMFPVPRE